MSKLFKLKQWLTIDETANHLTGVLGETVCEKDVYRLALDGHLRLSIDFVNHTQARLGKIVGENEVEWTEYPSDFFTDLPEEKGKTTRVMKSLAIGEDRFLNFESKVKSIDGIWDLMMVGSERLDIEHYYQDLIGGPAVTLVNIDGTFVKKGDNTVAQLMESFDDNEYQTGSKAHEQEIEKNIINKNIPFDKAEKIRQKFKKDRKLYLDKKSSNKNEDNYYPAGGLPSDGVLVVRTSEIMNFLTSLDGGIQKVEKPLSTKERHTMLVIIAALCKESSIDYSQRGIANAIQKMTEIIGAPITDDTIRNILKQIDEALELRSK